MSHVNIQRRNLLLAGGSVFALGVLAPNMAFASLLKEEPRSLALNNLHTGEKLDTEYFNGQDYVRKELTKINHICRDFRRNEIANMDKRLFDQVSAIQQLIGCNAEVTVISGYRSPATNEMLRKKSGGVAKKSYHMLGQALDMRLEGVPLAEVRKAALSLKAGGVGYYPKSNFVHIDTGPVRRW